MANLPDICVTLKILSSEYQPYACGKILSRPWSRPNLPISGWALVNLPISWIQNYWIWNGSNTKCWGQDLRLLICDTFALSAILDLPSCLITLEYQGNRQRFDDCNLSIDQRTRMISIVPAFKRPTLLTEKHHCLVHRIKDKPISPYRLPSLDTDTLDFIAPIIFEQVTIVGIKLMFSHCECPPVQRHDVVWLIIWSQVTIVVWQIRSQTQDFFGEPSNGL